MPSYSEKLMSRWYHVGGRAMHAWVPSGSLPEGRPRVVLVHGLGMSSRYMLPTAEQLAPDFPTYVPDLPGFGRSAHPPHPLRIDELADALAAWMDAAGLHRAALLGNSFGCQIITAFARRHAGRAVRAVFVGPTVDPERRTAHQQIARLLLDGLREPPSLLPLAAFAYLRAGLRRTWRTLRYLLEDPIERELPHVRIPTLVVRGARDPIVPQRWAEEAARLLPEGRLVTIPGAAHAVNYSAPAALAEVARPFLLAS